MWNKWIYVRLSNDDKNVRILSPFEIASFCYFFYHENIKRRKWVGET